MWKFIGIFSFLLLLQLQGLSYVAGHGAMVLPYNWMDAGGKYGMKSGLSCAPSVKVDILEHQLHVQSCYFFTNETFIEGERTLEDSMITYRDSWVDTLEKHPWRAPGTAKVYSPCGAAGGNPYGCPEGDPDYHKCFGVGFSWGPLAEHLNYSDVVVTEWERGSIVEAAWGIVANHGGGYSYRLCKIPEEGISGLTEECFQKTPLKFAGETQWVQYGEDTLTRIEFRANYTETGTYPAGSQWAKNPIPACWDTVGTGGYLDNGDLCKGGATQFPPPAPGLEGYGVSILEPNSPFDFSVGDNLEVPEDLEPGDYVLSFRWDCEQTPQIWTTCSSIKIV